MKRIPYRDSDLRDYFAGQALSALIMMRPSIVNNAQMIVRDAWLLADEMMKEREIDRSDTTGEVESE